MSAALSLQVIVPVTMDIGQQKMNSDIDRSNLIHFQTQETKQLRINDSLLLELYPITSIFCS